MLIHVQAEVAWLMVLSGDTFPALQESKMYFFSNQEVICHVAATFLGKVEDGCIQTRMVLSLTHFSMAEIKMIRFLVYAIHLFNKVH